MELFEAIRRDERLEQLSVRALADRHGVHRRTVRQALTNAVPPERKTPVRVAPKLEPAKRLIDAMLTEDLSAPRKQRHTARRVLARLVDEHEFTDLTYSAVRDYVARRRPADAGWGLGQLGKNPLHRRWPQVGIVHRHDRFARVEMRIGQHVFGVVHATGGNGVSDHRRLYFLDRPLRSPVLDDRVELVLVLAARNVGSVARILGQVRQADGQAEPGKDAVLIGADQEFAVLAPVNVRWRYPWQL